MKGYVVNDRYFQDIEYITHILRDYKKAGGQLPTSDSMLEFLRAYQNGFKIWDDYDHHTLCYPKDKNLFMLLNIKSVLIWFIKPCMQIKEISMKEFMNNIIKVFGFSDGGLSFLIYSLYLKIFKKLPYSIEMAIKPEFKERYIRIESTCLLLYFILVMSFVLFLTISNFHRIIIVGIHIVLIFIVFCIQIYLKKDLYK